MKLGVCKQLRINLYAKKRVRRELNIEKITDRTFCRKQKWSDHINRMGNTITVKIQRDELLPIGRLSIGLPRLGWADII